MKYVLALVAACCVLLTFLFVSVFKPHDSIDSNPGKSIERSDSEKRMSAYLAEERVKEIEAVKERIKGIQDRLDILRDNDPEKLSEQEISRQIGFGSLGYISPKQDYYEARKEYFSSHIKKLELNEKALAEANSHLRLLLSPENSAAK